MIELPMKRTLECPKETKLKHLAAPCLLVLLAFATIASACDNTRPAGRVLEWGVLDKETNTNTSVPAGGSLTIDPSHPYIVTLRVKEPDGIRSMSVWGEGRFKCSTDPSLNGGNSAWETPRGTLPPAGLPRKDTPIPGTSTYQGFVLTDRFDYHSLYCGKFSYGGTPEDYYAISGTLHIVGAETSLVGTETKATLDLSP